MRLQDMLEYLPPREDMMRLARYVSSMRQPRRSELALAGLIGAAIGAGITLLFAPVSGPELREEVRTRLDARRRGADDERAGSGV